MYHNFFKGWLGSSSPNYFRWWTHLGSTLGRFPLKNAPIPVTKKPRTMKAFFTGKPFTLKWLVYPAGSKIGNANSGRITPTQKETTVSLLALKKNGHSHPIHTHTKKGYKLSSKNDSPPPKKKKTTKKIKKATKIWCLFWYALGLPFPWSYETHEEGHTNLSTTRFGVQFSPMKSMFLFFFRWWTKKTGFPCNNLDHK